MEISEVWLRGKGKEAGCVGCKACKREGESKRPVALASRRRPRAPGSRDLERSAWRRRWGNSRRATATSLRPSSSRRRRARS